MMIKSKLLQNIHFIEISGCNTPSYPTRNGRQVCGIFLKGVQSFSEAEEECRKLDAFLPEIYSAEENEKLSKFRVSSMTKLNAFMGKLLFNLFRALDLWPCPYQSEKLTRVDGRIQILMLISKM